MKTNANDNYNKVRVLRKVRRQFLNKTPPEDDEQGLVPENVDPDTPHLAGIDGHTIKASLGMVEVRRKIRIGPEYLNQYFNVESLVVENRSQDRVVTLNLCPNENRSVIPWEYTTKRLESYGNLDLATWAHRIKDHYLTYDHAIADIHDQVTSGDPEIQASLNKVRLRAALARREIESKQAYTRCVQFFRKDTNQPLSYSFSEDFLEKLGFTPESFVRWSKENGIPRVLATSDVYEDIIKGFLACIPRISDPIQESPETKSFVYTKDGSKVQVTVRFVIIVDPMPEGTFFYGYLVLCDKKENVSENLALENSEELGAELLKKKAISGGGDDAEISLEKEDGKDE